MTARATEHVVAFHKDTTELCVLRLRDAYGKASGLFNRQLRDKRWDDTLGTEDLTSTGICLVGLHRAGVPPTEVGLDVGASLAAMPRVLSERSYPGGLGLVVWANAVWDGPAFSELLARAGVRPAELESLAGFTTMETAWLVSGLVHECNRSGNGAARACLEAAVVELRARFQREAALFRHASASAPLVHRLRRWIANFADQIYSVQALSFRAMTGGTSDDLGIAKAAAERLVALQGSLGQWWWHYDPRDSRVAQGFPVYSVHQHAMAPMALMACAEAGGGSFHAPVELSHRWIAKNELNVDLLDRAAGTLWRDIEVRENSLARVARQALSAVGHRSSNGSPPAERLKVNYETRPYEWAWCLYAGAIAQGLRRDGHVV
jgi:hypothetical protein